MGGAAPRAFAWPLLPRGDPRTSGKRVALLRLVGDLAIGSNPSWRSFMRVRAVLQGRRVTTSGIRPRIE